MHWGPSPQVIGTGGEGIDSYHIDQVIEASVGRPLVELLLHQVPRMQWLALHIVVNIISGSNKQTQQVRGASSGQASYCLCSSMPWYHNIADSGTQEHVQHMVNHGVIKPRCELLVHESSRIIVVALEGLMKILWVRPYVVRADESMN